MKPFHYVVLAIVLVGGVAGSVALIPSQSELGLMYFRGHQFTDAQPILEKRLASGDRSVDVVMPLAELYVQSGDVHRAVALMKQMTGSGTNRLDLFRKIAVFQQYDQQMQDRLRTLEIIEQLAGSEEGLRELTIEYRYANDNAKLIPALQTLIARYKADPAEYLELANLLASASRLADAANAMQRFEASHPGDISAESVELLVSLQLDAGQGTQALDRAGRWLAKHHAPDNIARFAALMRTKGKPALAAKLLEAFESAIDGSPVLLAEWVAEKNAAGQPGEAFARLNRLRRQKLLSDDLIEPLIELAIANDDTGTAVEVAMQFGFHRLNGQLRTALVERSLTADQPAMAFRIASAGGPGFLDQHPLLAARLALGRGDSADATRYLKTAGNLGKLAGADRLAIAALDASLGRRMEAADQLARIPLDSGSADLLLESARLYVTIGKAEDGEKRLDRIRNARSSVAVDRAWAIVAAASGKGHEVAGWMRGTPAGSIPEPLLRDLFYLAQDYKQPELTVTASRRLFNEHPDNANRLMLAQSLNAGGEPLLALPHVRALLPSGGAEAEELYTSTLLGAIRAASAAPAVELRKELLGFWTDKLGKPGLEESKQLEVIGSLIDLHAWSTALPKLAALAKHREDLAPLVIETAINAGNPKLAVEFLKSDLARSDLSTETRDARLYALLEHGGQAEALPYMRELARAGLPKWIAGYEEALEKLGRNSELLDFWRRRLTDKATLPDEKRGIAYRLVDLGKPEYARSVFAELANHASPGDPDVDEWLFLWGPRPGPEAIAWLEARARKAKGSERSAWLTKLLDAGAPDRVVAVISADTSSRGNGGDTFDTYMRALFAEGETTVLADAITREANALTDREQIRKLAAKAREMGGLAVAEPAYERLSTLAPADPEALHFLGTLAFSRARYSIARRYLSDLLKNNEGGFDDNYHFAEILWREHQRLQARIYYGRALRLIERMAEPTTEARVAHAQALFRCGYMDKALREYRTLIADDPRDGDLRADFAALLIEQAKYQEADEVLSSGVDSGAARVGLTRAQLLSVTGRLRGAIDLVEGLPVASEQTASVTAALSGFEQTAGRQLKALDLMMRALRMDPGNEDYQDALASLEQARAGQWQDESEYRVIQGAQSEEILRLAGQARISRNLSLSVSAEQDHVSIRDLQRMDGTQGTFAGVESRSEAEIKWDSASGLAVKGLLFAGDSSHGGGVAIFLPDLRGSTSATAEMGQPDWDFSQSLAQGGTRDRIEVQRDTTINARASAQVGAAINRYNLPGLPGAAESVAVSGNANVKLLRAPQLSLNYSFDGEYLLNSKLVVGSDGLAFKPLPLVSREVHGAGVHIEKEVARGLHGSGEAGVAVDRFGGAGPFVSGNLTYDPSRHFGARLDFDRRSYEYNSRQTVTGVRAGLFWRF